MDDQKIMLGGRALISEAVADKIKRRLVESEGD